MPAKTQFYPKTYVHQILEEMKRTELEGGYTKKKCLDLLAEQVYRFFSSGKTVEEIMAIVNRHHSIITSADVTKIIAKYTAPDEKTMRKPRKKKEDPSPEVKNEGVQTAPVTSYTSPNNDFTAEPMTPSARNEETHTAHSALKPLPSESDTVDPQRPNSESRMTRFTARHSA